MSQEPNESSGVVDDTTEVYRIQIPNPATELVLGKDERGYVGFHLRTDVQSENFTSMVGWGVKDREMELALGELDGGYKGFVARVGSGGAFIGAGGGYLNISTFEQAGKALTGVTQAVGGLQAVTALWESLWYPSEESKLKLALGGIGVAAQVGLDALYLNGGMVKSPGTVAIYGDASVYVGAPCSFTATGLGLATVNAGVFGMVGGMVVSSLGGGLITSVGALMSASVTAPTVSVVGDTTLTLAARHGEVRVEGKSVVVGATQGGTAGVVRAAGLLDFKQQATETVQVGADKQVEVNVGRAAGESMAPTRMRLSDKELRLDTRDAAVALGQHVGRLYADGSIVEVTKTGVTIGMLGVQPKTTFDALVEAAEAAYGAAVDGANAIQAAAATRLKGAIAGTVGAVAGGLVAGLTDPLGAKNAGVKAGEAAGGAAILGTLSALAVVSRIKKKAAAEARDAALKLAESARATAHEAAFAAESTVVDAALELPMTPKIEVKTDAIVLSVGPNKITIDGTGVTIEGVAIENKANLFDVKATIVQID